MIAANGVTARFSRRSASPPSAVSCGRRNAGTASSRSPGAGAALPATGSGGARRVPRRGAGAPIRRASPICPWPSSSSWARANTWRSGPGEPAPGHFGLAVKDYTHSTAPNRRYPDLITQRLVKAAIAGRAAPYSYDELDVLARAFTQRKTPPTRSSARSEVRRGDAPGVAIGEQFDALVTGASAKGTWARLLTVPVEGRVVRGFQGVDVGDRVRVKLFSVDVERGFIDFQRVDAKGAGTWTTPSHSRSPG